jgi:hypothetical protein
MLTAEQAQGLVTLLQNEPGNTPLGQLAYHIYLQGFNPSGRGNTAQQHTKSLREALDG